MYWAQLTMHKFEKFREDIEAVILPIGTTEAHGPHCPLGTDFMIPDHLAKMLNDAMPNNLAIAPTVNYGCSWNLGVFPGTVNISSEIMAQYIEEIGDGFMQWGIENIVFLNGHGGNRPALQIAAQHLADSGANVLLVNWWIDYMPQILTVCDSRGHAGEDETSLMLAIAPELVEMDLAIANNNKPNGQVFTADISYQTMVNALTGDATKASIEKGEKVFDLLAGEIVTLIDDFLKGKYVK